jgi:hypothetical protein
MYDTYHECVLCKYSVCWEQPEYRTVPLKLWQGNYVALAGMESPTPFFSGAKKRADEFDGRSKTTGFLRGGVR